jgi:putative two-component system response regulator
MNNPKSPVILVVDDTPDNIDVLSAVLSNTYRVKVATSGERAIKIAQANPDLGLILLDIMMPGMNGYQVCQHLKAHPETRNIPVIFVTAMSEVADEKYGLELGAVDFITKPVSPPIALARIKTQLSLKQMRDFLLDKNQFLKELVAARGQHFDPDMVDAFVTLQAQFEEIALRYSDNDIDLAKKQG